MKPLEEMGRYATVVIDPPWKLAPVGLTAALNGGSAPHYYASLPYDMMDFEAIRALPVDRVLADDSRLFLWTINKFLPLSFELLEHWGLSYSYTMTWVKSNGAQYPGGPQFNSEWCIVGKKGKPQFRETKSFAIANFWKWQGQSVKPEEFYDLLRRITPSPRLDIFGQRRIAGFESWGMEAPDEPALLDHFQTVLSIE